MKKQEERTGPMLILGESEGISNGSPRVLCLTLVSGDIWLSVLSHPKDKQDERQSSYISPGRMERQFQVSIIYTQEIVSDIHCAHNALHLPLHCLYTCTESTFILDSHCLPLP